MPLVLQPIIPFLVLLGTAGLTRSVARRRLRGPMAVAGTAAAGGVALGELMQLAPGERVDALSLGVFPGADPLIRFDALSLAFAVMVLVTAAGLMLVRTLEPEDRRDPFTGWLLTAAAALAVIFAGNLLLLYIALQVLSLVSSGTVDEAAPRGRSLRLVQQGADTGLLVAAALAIHSEGTSAFSGLPSDTFGPVAFALASLPALARLALLSLGLQRPRASVLYEPAVVWVAPAGYLVLRLLSITGGRPPGIPLEVALFSVALLIGVAALKLSWSARSWSERSGRLVLAQAALALAFSSWGTPMTTVASAWFWLLIVPLAGLCSLRSASDSSGRLVASFGLALIPPSAGSVGVWMGLSGLVQAGLPAAAFVAGLLVPATAITALSRLEAPKRVSADSGAIWGSLLGLTGAFPGILLSALVGPAARIIRSIPAGTLEPSLFAVRLGTAVWPAAGVAAVATGIIAVLLLRYPNALALRRSGSPAPEAARPTWLAGPRLQAAVRLIPWVAIAWTLFLIVVWGAVWR